MHPHLLFKKKLTIKHTLLMLNVQEKKTMVYNDLYMLSIITGDLHGI